MNVGFIVHPQMAYSVCAYVNTVYKTPTLDTGQTFPVTKQQDLCLDYYSFNIKRPLWSQLKLKSFSAGRFLRAAQELQQEFESMLPSTTATAYNYNYIQNAVCPLEFISTSGINKLSDFQQSKSVKHIQGREQRC